MRTQTTMHSLIRPLGLIALLFAYDAHAQMTFPPNDYQRVGLFAVDTEAGELVSASPSLESVRPAPADRSESVGAFTIEAMDGDLQAAPLDMPDSGGAIDRTAVVAGTVVDAEDGTLEAGPASVADSGGAIDRTADVEATIVDATDGALLSGPATSTTTPGTDDYSGMVGITRVDSANGALIHGPVRFIVPEPAAPAALLAAGLLLLGRWRSRQSAAVKRSAAR